MLVGPHTGTIVYDLASTLPDADTGAFTELYDASHTRAWTQRKMEDYKSHIFTLFAIHNSVAPINTLPSEILPEIFAYVPSVLPWCNALWMLSLGSVCRQWRSVLLATPEFWLRGLHCIMDHDFHEGYWEHDDITRGCNLFLARSAPYPLVIPMAYSSIDSSSPGWEAFHDQFDRVTVFEVRTSDKLELEYILHTLSCTGSMKRLERLQLEVQRVKVSTKDFEQWEAEGLPRLGRLEITGDLFCRATTVPSLHTVILTGPPRDIGSLPHLLDALEKCPALATLRLELTHEDDTFQNRTMKRVLDLPNLRNLAVRGGISDVRCLLSALSFPAATLVELDVTGTGNELDKGLVLPNVLPGRLSILGAHQMIDGIDRLCFHSKHQVRSEHERALVSLRAYAQGTERLRITPAFWLRSADHFLRFLKLFRECRVTELVLDLRHATGDMDGDFWAKFFAALPDVLRLQLLSPTVESRAMKRDVAKHYLASCGVPHLVPETDLIDFICRIAPPRPAVSLAWVLPCVDENCVLRMDELDDVTGVLIGHAGDDEDICLQRLEVYLTTLNLDPSAQQVLDVTDVTPDGMPSQRIGGLHLPGVAGLEDAAEVVVIGGRSWGFQ